MAIEIVVEIDARPALPDARRNRHGAAGAVALDRDGELRLRPQRRQEVADDALGRAGQRVACDVDDGIADAQAVVARVTVSVDRIDEGPIADVSPRPAVVHVLDALRRQEDRVGILQIETDAGQEPEDLAERLRRPDALAGAIDERLQVEAVEAGIVIVFDQVLPDLIQHLEAALAVDGNRLRRGGRGQAQVRPRVRPRARQTVRLQETNLRVIHGEPTGRHLTQARRSTSR